MTTLSVLCATRDPGPRVRALLEPLRALADEVVVAVDSRAGESELAEYATVADRLFRYERGPTHSSLTWLHDQCRGDWVLTVAGDEVASPALLEQLPELVSRRDVLQYWLPLRWVHPSGDRWLSGPPWHPDFHNRLVRNDGTLRFAGRKHELARPVLPARWLDAPLWHLALVVASPDERRSKVARNEAEMPGLKAAGGAPLNQAYYLPEETPGAPTEALPDADRRALAAVLEARPQASGGPPQVPLHERPVIERRWAGREPGEGAYRAQVAPLGPMGPLAPHEHRLLHFRIRNTGDETWPWGLDLPPLIRVGHRWLGEGGEAWEGARAPLPHDVAPGEASIVPVPVVAPARPGRWELEVDLVHEEVRWFGAGSRHPVAIE